MRHNSGFFADGGKGFEDVYTPSKFLAFGSFGEVWSVKHKRSGQMRAMKCLHLSEVNMEELENELNLLISLDHPHVIRLYDWYVFEGSLRIISELCEGGTLWEWMARKRPAKHA